MQMNGVTRRMEKSLKIKIIICTVLACIAVTILAFALVEKYTPSEEMGTLDGYYDVTETEAVILVETSIYEERALLRDDGIYLSYEMVAAVLTNEYYLDEKEEVLSYVLGDTLIRVYPEEACYYRNGEVCETKSPVWITAENEIYLSLEFVSEFSDMTYQFYENPNRVVIHNQWIDFLYYDAAEEAPVRFEPNIKSDIIRYVPAGEKVYYIGGTGKSGSSFVKVMLQDGIFGYVQRKFLTDSYYDAMQSNYFVPEREQTSLGETVFLGWHMVTVPEANGHLERVTQNAEGLNVISPTWYRLTDTEGGFSSLADEAYVEQAHAMGLQVWALMDNFDQTVDCYELFSSTKTRGVLIERMMDEAEEYGFDGWNIDFETLLSKAGPHYVQFLKELSVACKEAEIILSVDNYVPAAYNQFYDLKSQGRFVDYVIIMAYDEHYSGSKEAGSVASMGYLKKAITDTLDVVPAERIVMAVPFYTRLWAEETVNGVVTVTSEALTMNGAADVLKRHEVQAQWDEETHQNYAEYKEDGVTYKMWLEDEASIRERIGEIHAADVAGMAAWRLGFETEAIWPIIYEVLGDGMRE